MYVSAFSCTPVASALIVKKRTPNLENVPGVCFNGFHFPKNSATNRIPTLDTVPHHNPMLV